ncbi:MAG: proline--tRNA ligase [Actinobacteria bacterium]|nr:proline--tRNA ligase [Actinomycetota bacterium]
MRASQLFARTLREAPAEAEVASHKLLLRAAHIRKLMAGVYTWLPLGFRTLSKIEAIIREEMNASGAQEIRMPIVVPAEPWKATGRWQTYGEEMFKLKDRHDRELGLGPTQEEVVTPLVAGEFASYRDLPVNLYQIEWKYRDELRPRFGLLRGREFLMKDAYSFDRDVEGLRLSYRAMYEAYERIFDRCGLKYRIVEADPGSIGGDVNHEYMALADVGEDLFVHCENGDYAADVEAAEARAPEHSGVSELEPLTEVSTPDRPGIDAVADLLRLPASRMLKCMLFDAGGRTVATLVPGDREVNEKKVARAMWPAPVRLFEDHEFAERGFVKGYVGPQSMPDDVLVIADRSVGSRGNWVTGANRPDHHVTGANVERDFRVDRWEDVSRVREGDPCPRCGGTLHIGRSIVVGHIYQLGTRYSKPLKATFVDEDGTEQPYQMGCYGIGLSRIVAACAEQFHDEAGLLWPRALAPYEVVVIATNMDQPAVVEAAETLYSQLQGAGLDVVFDDRDVTAGVKFADADLIGYPLHAVVGRRGLESGSADLKLRATGERRQASLSTAAGDIVALLATAP